MFVCLSWVYLCKLISPIHLRRSCVSCQAGGEVILRVVGESPVDVFQPLCNFQAESAIAGCWQTICMNTHVANLYCMAGGPVILGHKQLFGMS